MKNSPLIWRGFLHPEFKTGEIMEIVKIEMNLKAVNKSISPHCAVKAISLLTVKVSDGEQAGFGNYRSYKLDYSEKFYQTIH
ncbi:DNA breaking-rejoining protein [Salmonella enterica]|uniref:DNA breaking-rejoining protein n=1 Tax=Salmonella enterica TaxID=28901 RepID=UPI000A03A96D|nr:DNA breaking-rejoining protein [Salmonella enterica]ORH08599.1 DNA breaking-rejoining protein [Salmonella enterica subsp. enterica serovar Newport]